MHAVLIPSWAARMAQTYPPGPDAYDDEIVIQIGHNLSISLNRHSREGGNQADTRGSAEKTHIAGDAALAWIPAFAGLTASVIILQAPAIVYFGSSIAVLDAHQEGYGFACRL